jgi:hypothetical protein
MSGAWRLEWFYRRQLPVAALLCAFSVLVTPYAALAQSSVGQAINAATGRSLADSVDKNTNDFIVREVLGAGADGNGSGGSNAGTSGGGGGGTSFIITATPSGRLRGSEHDGLKVTNPGPDNQNFGWRTHEASVFANLTKSLPGTVLGGQVKLSGFAGYNWVDLDIRNNAPAFTLDPDQFGSADNGSAIFGGTALWSKNNTYALASIVGFLGQTHLNDSIDDCGLLGPGHPASDCELHRYKFNTSGLMGTLTTGQVFKLSKATSGPLLDVRGSLSYTANYGEAFLNEHFGTLDRDQQKYKFSTFAATLSTTLFTNIATQNSGLLRPYIQAYARQEMDYKNRLHFVISGGGGSGSVDYDQGHTYLGVDTGLTYTQGNMTLGAAIYYDASYDEGTLGGRLGASWKLN